MVQTPSHSSRLTEPIYSKGVPSTFDSSGQIVGLQETDLKKAEKEYGKIKKEIHILKGLEHVNIAK
jgi:hypothetical protein